jgi:hypothetical protein
MRTIRVCAIACVVIAGCKGAEPTKVDNATKTGSAPAPLDLPRVDEDRAVVDAAKMPRPAAVVWIGAKGGFEVSRVDGTWTGELPTGKRVPAATVEAVFSEVTGVDLSSPGDDPPPPPPDDTTDDGSDESGGTGTAIALDEGKMGNKDSDRAEGQYKMKKEPVDPQLARQQAIEQARKAGILGGTKPHGRASVGNWVLPSTQVAELRPDYTYVIAAAPGAPAIQLARMVAAEGGALAVSDHDKLALLSRGYVNPRDMTRGDGPHAWVELHVTADGIHVVETSKHDQAIIAWKQGATDRDALRASYTKLKAERFAGAEPPVDILVGDGPTAQQLVDVLVTLDGLGAKATSLGVLVGTTEARLAQLAEAAKPQVAVGQPVANGDLDKAIIRREIKANIAKITACYEKQLTAHPDLHGTVMTQFFISPTGAVKTSEASGVDPEVAMCVATVIKAIVFPKPKGGGGVQVNYPFTFRPSGTP